METAKTEFFKQYPHMAPYSDAVDFVVTEDNNLIAETYCEDLDQVEKIFGSMSEAYAFTDRAVWLGPEHGWRTVGFIPVYE